MIAKIEMVQEYSVEGVMVIRVNYYREPGEVGYEEHHVQVPVVPEGGYPGKLTKEGAPVDQKDYDKWRTGLPLVWQNNPCLNQFVSLPMGTPLAKVETLISDHALRLKSAPLKADGFPDVVDTGVREAFKNRLETEKLRIATRPRSILSKNAVVATHPLLAKEVKS
jgi:hypothetical protein